MYTSVSSDIDLPSWGIPLMEAYDSEPEEPLSPVHAPEYPEYLAPSDDDITPAKDQPLPVSPIALSPSYIFDSEPIEDGPEEDLEMDLIDYAADEEEEESSKEDEEEEEEEKHLALTDFALSVFDYVPLAEEMEPFETNKALIYVRPHTPPSPSTETRIAEYAAAPIPPSPSPSSLSPLSSPLLLIPSPPLPLPSPNHRDIIPEADMSLRKRARFTAPSHRFEIRERSAAATVRQTGHALTSRIDYGFIDTLDTSTLAIDETVITALEGVNERMTDLAATHRHDSEEFYTRHQDAEED
ncbi:hypothetical protein Tco_0969914 [Tanacetum coccineum]